MLNNMSYDPVSVKFALSNMIWKMLSTCKAGAYCANKVLFEGCSCLSVMRTSGSLASSSCLFFLCLVHLWNLLHFSLWREKHLEWSMS